MNRSKTKPKTGDAQKVKALVAKLNQYRHEYYNLAAPSVSDAAYDRLYDELQELEKRTGIIYGNSPTQTVGYAPVGSLEKVRHSIPLLSLDKTKQTEELQQMSDKAAALLMLKLDGLTVKLCYENGELAEASTRGDGDMGELITHNIPAFCNVPLKIPYEGRLVITGEGVIHNDDFEKLKDMAAGSGDKEICNARNLAAGSIRLLNPSACKERHIYFYAFNMIEGMEAFGEIADSRGGLLKAVQSFGVDVCPFLFLQRNAELDEIEAGIAKLKSLAKDKDLPIDGMVLRYDSLAYSKGCGRTGHHYKDGIAFKFEDDTYETVFRSVEWETGRSGEIAPVAVFDPVEIDGCSVSRASLHNLTFIKALELHSGCRVLVSKRNMIIPHIEENLDRGSFDNKLIPKTCPCCGKAARVFSRVGDKGRLIETLHCDNKECGSRILHKFIHFAEKKAMDISGISEATIERFIEKGFLKTFHDFYHLNRHREEIVKMDGFGEKSYQKIQESVKRSRNTTFVRYVVAMDIPMIGRTASRVLDNYFNGDLQEFAKAAVYCFDFTSLPDFGETMSRNIWEWFHNHENLKLWKTLQKELNFEHREVKCMMEFEEFAKAVLTAVREKADGAFSAWITTVTKNNGVKMTGISAVRLGNDIGPCVYLESYYREYRHGRMTCREAAADVYMQVMEHGNDFKDISLSDFLRWETIRHHVYAKLINADMNREMLGMIPHRFFLDLAVVYYVKLGEMEGNAGMMSMIIRNNYMEMWEQDEESLYQMAAANMRRNGGAVLKRMEDILKAMMPEGGPLFADMDLGVKMYVLTNRSRHLGAAELLDAETLRGISEKLSGDFVVLPSSIHETIILPSDGEADYPSLKNMVCEVNATEVSEDERLSDHVYRFDRKAGRLAIAA